MPDSQPSPGSTSNKTAMRGATVGLSTFVVGAGAGVLYSWLFVIQMFLGLGGTLAEIAVLAAIMTVPGVLGGLFWSARSHRARSLADDRAALVYATSHVLVGLAAAVNSIIIGNFSLIRVGFQCVGAVLLVAAYVVLIKFARSVSLIETGA